MHPAVVEKGKGLREAFEELLSGCNAEVRFLGAKELLEEARKNPSHTLSLRFVESAISVESSYIVLANLYDYFDFVTDDGSLRKYIFESNVRDFQGNVEVNNDIKTSLEQPDAPEFWWLNNGVTIIASKASISGKVLALDDVQIVNGLQTSVRI